MHVESSIRRTGTSRVLLVVPPFHNLGRPSIAAGLLAAGLEQAGIGCDVWYLNLDFAALAGQQLYDIVPERGYPILLGEWLFTGELFGLGASDPDRYVADLLRGGLGGRFANRFDDATVDHLIDLRRRVPDLLDRIFGSVTFDNYALVGATSMFQQHCAALSVLRRAKAAQPAVATILGGANCDGEMGRATHDLFPFVDYVCSGEGDRVFPRLVSRILAGQPCDHLPGIVARRSIRIVGAEIHAPPVLDLDSLPYPNYDHYFEQLPAKLPDADFGPMLVLETSRGCWWGQKHHCTFCGLNGQDMAYRRKTPARARAELDHLVERYRALDVQTTDNIVDLGYFETFLTDLAHRDPPVSMFYETKANLTKEQVRVLARAGVREIQPGIESLSTPVLRLMEKGVTQLQNVRLLKWCAEIGVRPIWNLLFGFPGEEPEEYSRIAALIPSLTHLEPPRGKTRIWLDRYSPYFLDPAASGLTNVRAMLHYRYVYPFSDADLDRVAYHFDYDYADGRQPELYARPALEAIDAWRAQHAGSALTLHDAEGQLVIRDSRPAATQSETVLSGAARLAYLALDAGTTVQGIETALVSMGEAVATSKIQTSLEQWLEARLVMQEGNRYLSLALDPRERIEKRARRRPAGSVR